MPEERKLVTILFADIVGSTSLTGAHDAEVVQSVMDAAFERIAPIIRAHGGTVEKFIGDAVMSVFGVPAAHDDDAQRGVRAAFAIRDAVAGAGGPLPLEVRVGVNTGEAVARTDGADQRMVTGIAVNFAQRLQSAAQPGEILVGSVTQGLTKGAVRYSAPRNVEAKGIGDVTAFVAEALLDAMPEQHRGLEGLRAPMIGRDRELRILNEVHARSRETREAHLVTVYGPAGAGKSRLVDEFARTVGRDRVRSGRCLPYGEGITYYRSNRSCARTRVSNPTTLARALLRSSAPRPLRPWTPMSAIRSSTGYGYSRASPRSMRRSLTCRVTSSMRSCGGVSVATSSVAPPRTRSSSCSRTSTGPSPRCSTSSSLSPNRRAVRSSSCASRDRI